MVSFMGEVMWGFCRFLQFWFCFLCFPPLFTVLFHNIISFSFPYVSVFSYTFFFAKYVCLSRAIYEDDLNISKDAMTLLLCSE